MTLRMAEGRTDRLRAEAIRRHAGACKDPEPSRQMVVECGNVGRCVCSCGAVVVVKPSEVP